MCMKCFGRIIGGETYISWPRSAARQVTNSKPRTWHSLAVFVSVVRNDEVLFSAGYVLSHRVPREAMARPPATHDRKTPPNASVSSTILQATR